MKRLVLFAMGVLLLAAACAAPAAPAPTTTQAPLPIPTLAPTQAPVSAPTVAPLATTATSSSSSSASFSSSQPAQAPTTSATTAPSSKAPAETYTVLVGGEDTTQGATLEAFFPSIIHVHVGDTVVWKQNAHEIHTVTFLPDVNNVPELLIPVPGAPAGAMMFNPQSAFPIVSPNGSFDGSGVASSGIMGMEGGQSTEFRLTFTKAGTYRYVCIVHAGMQMLGTVVVADAGVALPSLADQQAMGKQEMDNMLAQIPAAVKAANALVKPDSKNADGSTTHYVMMGYDDGQLSLTRFFPDKVNAAPGDRVNYFLGSHQMAPHTATFLNGGKEPALVNPQPQPNGPPLLVFNPAVAVPQNLDKPLTNQGIFNSGLLDPTAPTPKDVTFQVGETSGSLEFTCLLHDGNGMEGTLTISK